MSSIQEPPLVESPDGRRSSSEANSKPPFSRQSAGIVGSSRSLFLPRLHILLLLFTAAIFAVTAWFAQTTFSVSSIDNARSGSVLFISFCNPRANNSTSCSSALFLGVSSTLTILRLLEGVLSACSTTVLLTSFGFIQWALTSRDDGVSSLCLLGLSPSSGYLGTLGLAASRHSRVVDRLAAGGRISLVTAIWIAGLLLFAKTQLTTVYESVDSYAATGGVGRFNGSYIPEYLQRYKNNNDDYSLAVLPYSTINTASNLVVNPMHSTAISPVSCEQGRICHSYLLSGGLIMTTPWPPTNYTAYPVISLQSIPATHIDFVRGIHNDTFNDAEDCEVFGDAGFLIAMKFCLARSVSSPGSLIAGTLESPCSTCCH